MGVISSPPEREWKWYSSPPQHLARWSIASQCLPEHPFLLFFSSTSLASPSDLLLKGPFLPTYSLSTSAPEGCVRDHFLSPGQILTPICGSNHCLMLWCTKIELQVSLPRSPRSHIQLLTEHLHLDIHGLLNPVYPELNVPPPTNIGLSSCLRSSQKLGVILDPPLPYFPLSFLLQGWPVFPSHT